MDAQTATLVGLAILAVVVIIAILRYRGRGKFEVKGPGGLGATFEGENQQAPSAQPVSSRVGRAVELMQRRVEYAREIGHQNAEKWAAEVEAIRARIQEAQGDHPEGVQA